MFKQILAIAALLLLEVKGHGYMWQPVQRSSLWRVDETAPRNYNDNENFCGGSYVQWEQNEGRCGLCGDNFVAPQPRPNENGGTYGQGQIVQNYTAGSIINVEVNLTQNHLGWFQFSLCELQDLTAPESGEDCFQELVLADGSDRYSVGDNDRYVNVQVQLPERTCEHCVFRWHYHSGNNWGDCGNGVWDKGCGPQETFRNCADIAIV